MTNQTYGNGGYIKNYGSNQRDSYRPQRPKITNLTKTYKSFEDGYAELIKLIPEIKTYGGEDGIYESVIGNIIDTIHDNIPSHSNSSYPNTFSFSIDSHEVGLRTDAGMAFGWRTFFNKDSGEVVYKFRVSFITIPAHRKAIIQNMKDNGWELFETGRQSRFWDKVDTRRSGRRDYQSKDVAAVAEVPNKEEETEEVTAVEEPAQEVIIQEPAPAVAEQPDDEPKGEINEDIAEQLKGYTFD